MTSNYKSKLNELCQSRSWKEPQYETSMCPEPSRIAYFISDITLENKHFLSEKCTTKKGAEQNAAMLAYHYFIRNKE